MSVSDTLEAFMRQELGVASKTTPNSYHRYLEDFEIGAPKDVQYEKILSIVENYYVCRGYKTFIRDLERPSVEKEGQTLFVNITVMNSNVLVTIIIGPKIS